MEPFSRDSCVTDRPCEVSRWSDSVVSASDHGEDDYLYKLAVTMASSRLGRHSRSSLDKLRTEAESECWTEALFSALRSSHEHWQIKNEEKLRSEYDYMGEWPKETTKDQISFPSVRGRSGNVLQLQSLSREALIPPRSGTF